MSSTLRFVSLMKIQQDGKVSKAFPLKLCHLNDFVKPANSKGENQPSHGQMNETCVSGITRILIYHSESSVAYLVNMFLFWVCFE